MSLSSAGAPLLHPARGRGRAIAVLPLLGAKPAKVLTQADVATPPKGSSCPRARSEKKERFLTERAVAAVADALAVMEGEHAINPTMAAAVRLLMVTG